MPASDLPKQLASSRMIDLSQPLAEDLPTTWPGHMPYQHKLWNWYIYKSKWFNYRLHTICS